MRRWPTWSDDSLLSGVDDLCARNVIMNAALVLGEYGQIVCQHENTTENRDAADNQAGHPFPQNHCPDETGLAFIHIADDADIQGSLANCLTLRCQKYPLISVEAGNAKP